MLDSGSVKVAAWRQITANHLLRGVNCTQSDLDLGGGSVPDGDKGSEDTGIMLTSAAEVAQITSLIQSSGNRTVYD